MDGTYVSNHPTWHIEDSPWKASQIEKIIRSNAIQFNSVVEVGCGAGQIIHELSSSFPHAQFYGFEISQQASTFWSRQESDRVHLQLRDFLETSDFYDLLLLIDVFEHVPDYMGFLKSLSLRSKYFIFNVPLDMHLLGVTLDHQIDVRERYGHLHYFSRATALQTLIDTGYEVIDNFYAPGFLGAPPASSRKTTQQKVLYPLRYLIHKISPKWNAKLLGGSSLMVLAKNGVSPSWEKD
jgi:SAM-dependent methyltransferase